MIIKITEIFTETPGGRHVSDGEFSGEAFRNNVLKDAYNNSAKKGEKLIVDMDGCYGYPPSFLEESFGGLARELNDNTIMKNIEIICYDEPHIIGEIENYVKKSLG